jgi:hypothetical protein
MVSTVMRAAISRKASGRDAGYGGETEVRIAEFIEAADDGLRGFAAEASLLVAELLPQEAEVIIRSSLVNTAKADGLGVAAM